MYLTLDKNYFPSNLAISYQTYNNDTFATTRGTFSFEDFNNDYTLNRETYNLNYRGYTDRYKKNSTFLGSNGSIEGSQTYFFINDFSDSGYNKDDYHLYNVDSNNNLSLIETTNTVLSNGQLRLSLINDVKMSSDYFVILSDKESPSKKDEYIVTIGTLNNCTCNYNTGDIIDSSNNIVITANDGFFFYEENYTYLENETAKIFNKSNNNKILEISTKDITNNIAIGNITATKERFYLTLGTLTNCRCNYNNNDLLNTEKNIVITANDGYNFNDGLQFTVGTVKKDFTYNTDKTILTISVENFTDNIIVNSIEAVLIPVYRISITGSFVNCFCNYENGEKISKDKNIIITANDGYEFTGVFTLLEGYITREFVNNGESLVYSLEHWDNDDIILNQSYNANLISENVPKWVNIYRVNSNILEKLSDIRYYESTDRSQYIYKLYYLPYFTSLINHSQNKKAIILGDYDTNIDANYFDSFNININLGSIEINSKYKNIYAYKNTTCILNVLNFDNFGIDVKYVVNQTLTFYLKLNLFEGTGTLEVYSSLTNNIVYSTTDNIANVIPFKQNETSIVGNINVNVKTLNKKITVNLVRNVPYKIDDDIFGKPVYIEKRLNNNNYYIVNDIKLETNATKTECQMIKNLLRDGIHT